MWGDNAGEGSRRGPVSLALMTGAAVIGGLLGWCREAPVSPQPVQLPAPIQSTSLIEVHVAGWVNSPGVVSLPEGAIAADAVNLAGGLREGALVALINLAAPLRAGDQILVPGPGEGAPGVPSDGGLIALNRASAQDLEALPGVGPVLAERIVAFRDANGPFSTVEDLLQVPGIGETKLASIRDLVRVP